MRDQIKGIEKLYTDYKTASRKYESTSYVHAEIEKIQAEIKIHIGNDDLEKIYEADDKISALFAVRQLSRDQKDSAYTLYIDALYSAYGYKKVKALHKKLKIKLSNAGQAGEKAFQNARCGMITNYRVEHEIKKALKIT